MKYIFCYTHNSNHIFNSNYIYIIADTLENSISKFRDIHPIAKIIFIKQGGEK